MYQTQGFSELIKTKTRQALSSKRLQGFKSGIFLLGLTSFFTDISSEMVAGIIPLYAIGALHLSFYQYGFIDGLQQGSSVLVRLASGIFSDHFRKAKEIATTGYVLSAVSKIGLLIGSGGWGFLSGIIFTDRIGKGIRTPSRDALIAANAPVDGITTAFGIHRAMDTAGAMLGPLIAVGILFFLPEAYHVVFAVSAVTALIGVAIIGLFVRNPSSDFSHSVETFSSDSFRSRFAVFLNLPKNIPLMTITLASSLLAFVTLSDGFLYLIVSKIFNIRSAFFPLLFASSALVFMLFAIPAGLLADKIGQYRIFIGGYLVLAFVYIALLVLTPSTLLLLSVLMCVGLYYAMTDSMLMSMVYKFLPSQGRATGFALVTTATAISKIASSIAFGFLWSWVGQEKALTIFSVSFLSVILIVAVVLFFIHKKNLHYGNIRY